ncbi:DUF5677 domain-containing protein [Salipaludibacillus agaradhaerens]|uniref:DUF5677 domain-containing protein n=1 Tax=Salipaludibacillus agaradhaerens TaxID=76935 RepID=UPI001FE274CA|nr:DUF5677 domain-containing protein [Salipaludibacillus agaradhaerens]
MLKKTLKESNGAIQLIINNYFNPKNKILEVEDVVILAFFEDLTEKVESLRLLVEESKSASLDTILRSIFESYVYLKLLLKNDYMLYGRSYFAAKKINNLQMFHKTISQGKQGEAIRELLGDPTIEDLKRKANIEDAEDIDTEIIKVKEDFSDVFKHRNEKQVWYNLDGKTANFEQLCNKKGIDMSAEYDLIYRSLSKEVHAKDVLNRWRFEKEQFSILEQPTDPRMHISMSNTFLLNTIDRLYPFYGLKSKLRKFRTFLGINYKLSK